MKLKWNKHHLGKQATHSKIDADAEKQQKGIPINKEVEVLKRIQLKYFLEELDGKETHLKINLGLFDDVDGILRCRGCLSNTGWPNDKHYLILFPKEFDYTNKIIIQIHNVTTLDLAIHSV